MSPPLAKSCYVPECTYTTPQGIPSYELILKDLEMHVKYAHKGATPAQETHGGGNAKADRLPRPSIGEGVTEADWAHFLDKWNRYKRSALQGVSDQYVTDQLWACCESSLETAIYNNGVNSETNETNLLEAMKRLAVRVQNNLVNVVKFLDLTQDQDETAGAYTARLKGNASICNFTIKCKSVTCDKMSSYSDQMVSHQLVRGLADPSIQEQILSHAADNPGLDLNATLKFIEAKESGKRSSNILTSAGGLNKIAVQGQKKNIRENSERFISDKKCGWCGLTGHGARAPTNIRREKCKSLTTPVRHKYINTA